MEPACLRDATKKKCCHIPPASVQIAEAQAPLRLRRGCGAAGPGPWTRMTEEMGKGRGRGELLNLRPAAGGDPQREGRARSSHSGQPLT